MSAVNYSPDNLDAQFLLKGQNKNSWQKINSRFNLVKNKSTKHEVIRNLKYFNDNNIYHCHLGEIIDLAKTVGHLNHEFRLPSEKLSFKHTSNYIQHSNVKGLTSDFLVHYEKTITQAKTLITFLTFSYHGCWSDLYGLHPTLWSYE